MIAAADPAGWLSYALGFGALVGGCGYAVGQFFSSKRKGHSDALQTALAENAVGKIRADRLEAELHAQAQATAEVRVEAKTLRTLLTTGAHLADPLKVVIEQEAGAAVKELETFARQEHEKTRAAIQRIKES